MERLGIDTVADTIAVSRQINSRLDAHNTVALTYLSDQINQYDPPLLPSHRAVDFPHAFPCPGQPSEAVQQSDVHTLGGQLNQHGQNVAHGRWLRLVRARMSSDGVAGYPYAFSLPSHPSDAVQQLDLRALDVRNKPGQYVEHRNRLDEVQNLLSWSRTAGFPYAFSWSNQPGDPVQQPAAHAIDVRDQYVEYGKKVDVLRNLLSGRCAARFPYAISRSDQPSQIFQSLSGEFWKHLDPQFVSSSIQNSAPVIRRNQRLLDALDRMRASGDYYVYPGGQIPNDEAFNDARLFVQSLPLLTIVPKISLVVDGEVNFKWNSNDIHIDLGFYGDGEGGSYFAKDRSGNKYYCDSFSPNELPEEILCLIS